MTESKQRKADPRRSESMRRYAKSKARSLTLAEMGRRIKALKCLNGDEESISKLYHGRVYG